MPQPRHRSPPDWDKFYESGIPDILYRVHDGRCHTRYSPTEGFFPKAHRDGVPIHCDAVAHCAWNRGYSEIQTHYVSETSNYQTAFVSLSCSFIYAVWGALWRNLGQNINDVEIWFIDGASLKMMCQPVRSRLFHAAELVQKCGRECVTSSEDRERALNFSNLFDTILVLGRVPPQAIIGNISLTDLLPLLPPYFFTEQPAGRPVPRDCGHLVKYPASKWRPLPFRDAHEKLESKVPNMREVRNALEQANLALKLAHHVCRDVSFQEPGVRVTGRRLVGRLAFGVLNCLINWEDMRILDCDGRWEYPGGVWITKYLDFRIPPDPLPRLNLEVCL